VIGAGENATVQRKLQRAYLDVLGKDPDDATREEARYARAVALGTLDRESLGIMVRDAWVLWAREQPNPKASWLVPWEGLSEPDKEVDRRIGETIAQHALRAVDASRPEPPRAPLPEVDAEDLWTDYRAGRGAMYAYERKAFFAGVEAGRRTRAPLTEEEARALAEHVGIKLGLTKDDREEPVTTATRAILGWFASRGDIPPDVRPAPASSPLGEWQCASCHARETEAHREWCQVEDKAGTIASRATDVRPVAPFTEEEARRSLGAALREAAKQNAIYSPMCAVRAGADVGRVAPKVEEPMLTPAEEADVIAGAPAQIAPHGQSEIEILRAAVVRAHERIDALEKKPVEATIAAMAAQIERLDAEMRHVLVTIARDPKVEGDDVEAEEDPRTRLHEGDPEGKPSTLKERVSRVVLGTIDGEPVHVRATAKDKP
jgi:hypothetical protein